MCITFTLFPPILVSALSLFIYYLSIYSFIFFIDRFEVVCCIMRPVCITFTLFSPILVSALFFSSPFFIGIFEVGCCITRRCWCVSHLLCSPQSWCQHSLYLCESCPLPDPKRKSPTKVSQNLQYISTHTLSKYVSKKIRLFMMSETKIYSCVNCLLEVCRGKVQKKSFHCHC